MSQIPAFGGLVRATQFDQPEWQGYVYPGAGELTIHRRFAVAAPAPSVQVHASNSLDVSIRRSRTAMRRYAVENALDTSLVLTSSTPCTRSELLDAFAIFKRRLGRHIGAVPPYLVVAEQVSENDRAHLHVLVGSNLAPSVCERWKAGRVLEPIQMTTTDEIRQMAHYMAKDFWLLETGAQRYRVAKGYLPERIPISGKDSVHRFLGSLPLQCQKSLVLPVDTPRSLHAQWSTSSA